MISKVYLAVILVVCLINRCYSQELAIKKLQRLDNGKLSLCFENSEKIFLESIEYYQIVIIDTTQNPVIERPVINEGEVAPDGASTCVVFENYELKDYGGREDTYFILTGRDSSDNEVVFGTAQIDMPNFPEKDEEDSVIAYYVGSDSEKSLRVNNHKRPDSGTWTITINGEGTKLICHYPEEESNEDPCFVIGGLGMTEHSSTLTMCIDVTNKLPDGGDISICEIQFTPNPLPAVGPSLTAATLTYTKPNLVLYANPQNHATTMDVVLYDDSGLKIFVKQSSPTTLDIGTHTADLKKYNVLLVGLKSANVKESTLAYFQDFKVVTQELSSGSGIFEVQWKRNADVEQYDLTRSTLQSGDGDSFTQTTVNCPGAESTFCYGYFVQLEPGDYVVTFKPFKNDVANANNEIISESAEITTENKDKNTKITLNKTNITWNFQNEAVVKLCFHYSDDFKLVEKDYEVIIVNKEGQWRREKSFIQAEQGLVCSVEMTLPSEYFIRNSVLNGVIVKRHENGFDVIQSGFSTFELY